VLAHRLFTEMGVHPSVPSRWRGSRSDDGCAQTPDQVGSSSDRNPKRLAVRRGGAMSSRMASKTALNCTSYRFSSSSSLRARWAWDAVIRRSRTKARAHDLDLGRDRPRAVQDTREHRDALLGEGVRRVSPTATTF